MLDPSSEWQHSRAASLPLTRMKSWGRVPQQTSTDRSTVGALPVKLNLIPFPRVRFRWSDGSVPKSRELFLKAGRAFTSQSTSPKYIIWILPCGCFWSLLCTTWLTDSPHYISDCTSRVLFCLWTIWRGHETMENPEKKHPVLLFSPSHSSPIIFSSTVRVQLIFHGCVHTVIFLQWQVEGNYPNFTPINSLSTSQWMYYFTIYSFTWFFSRGGCWLTSLGCVIGVTGALGKSRESWD